MVRLYFSGVSRSSVGITIIRYIHIQGLGKARRRSGRISYVQERYDTSRKDKIRPGRIRYVQGGYDTFSSEGYHTSGRKDTIRYIHL